jgi:hypothetical protein
MSMYIELIQVKNFEIRSFQIESYSHKKMNQKESFLDLYIGYEIHIEQFNQFQSYSRTTALES